MASALLASALETALDAEFVAANKVD